MPLRVQPSPSVWLVERGSFVPPLVASPIVPVSVSLILRGHRKPRADALARLVVGRLLRVHELVAVAHVRLPADARRPLRGLADALGLGDLRAVLRRAACASRSRCPSGTRRSPRGGRSSPAAPRSRSAAARCPVPACRRAYRAPAAPAGSVRWSALSGRAPARRAACSIAPIVRGLFHEAILRFVDLSRMPERRPRPGLWSPTMTLLLQAPRV